MKATYKKATNSLKRGQTLVMAMIILGVLMILGVVFIALVSHNIRGAANSHNRSLAYDLAESGVRYAHTQMLESPSGADWRPPLIAASQLRKEDPDYEYLRLPDPADPNDHGGPDKQGPYSRIAFDRGRALIRVRYAPSDPTIFSSKAVGDMIQPGLARDYTIIESVGKSGNYLINDPTTASLQSGAAREVTESKKVVAFVSCGLIEQARFETNVYHVSTPIEIGWPNNQVGAVYGDANAPVGQVNVPVVLGTAALMFDPYNPNSGNPPNLHVPALPIGGSMYVNGDLMVYGTLQSSLNQMLGDGIFVAGTIRGADDNATLSLDYASAGTGAWQELTALLRNNGGPQQALNSDSPNFSTHQGVLKDAYNSGDSEGYTRGIPFKDPPSITWTDPDSGITRYVQMTQLSGKFYSTPNGTGNAGRYGFGQGVYVNNTADIQVPTDEQGREDVGSAESLVYDWLNPDNGQANSGWQGAFYVPRGAYLRFVTDGFYITRDGRAPASQRTWREPDGSSSLRPGAFMGSTNSADIVDSPYVRYKLVPDATTGQVYIFSSYSTMPNGQVIDVNAVNPSNINTYRAAGYPFNGVLYFAGNVRVRGEIPTDMQISVVSNATVYIEGSITKGTLNNGMRSGPLGARITTPSKSMLGLFAKDYICLNTTQFFGTAPGQVLEEVKDNAGPVEWNPLRVRSGGSIDFMTEFSLDPNTTGGNVNNPSTWKPFAMNYVPASGPGFENTNLLLAHSMDDGPASATFLNMNVNYNVGTAFGDGTGPWQYLFDLNGYNAASSFYAPGFVQPDYSVANAAPLYGLGAQSWQRYSKFEGTAFPLVTSDFTFNPATLLMTGSNTSRSGLYNLLAADTNDFTIGLKDTLGGMATNDYIIARAAVVPHDIRIEATLFAEQGSFFVIPGPWFNPNPNDRRDTYMSLGTTQDERNQARLEDFGSMPNMPFYGEPLDVKISIFGALSENMPPPMSQQAEWLKKWGWIPRYHGATNELIPLQHTSGFDVTTGGGNAPYVPNITITYDPGLATDRNSGFVGTAGPAVDVDTLIRYQRVDATGTGGYVYYALPPIPRLPVSPTLAYFGEVNP
ncbi:MAG TPA: hypothetical protein VHE55_16810 [Fimbriimonadaceae bacterium]|nr:hypothetical protein [Fimbriimonadaceae bacterium]